MTQLINILLRRSSFKNNSYYYDIQNGLFSNYFKTNSKHYNTQKNKLISNIENNNENYIAEIYYKTGKICACVTLPFMITFVTNEIYIDTKKSMKTHNSNFPFSTFIGGVTLGTIFGIPVSLFTGIFAPLVISTLPISITTYYYLKYSNRKRTKRLS